MRTLAQWMDKYSESHQNPVNKRIHDFCVPAILWSVVGMLLGWVGFFGALVSCGLASVFYARMGQRIFFAMLVVFGFCMWTQSAMGDFAAPVSLGVFVGAWIGQFIGHKIEGKKPSFFEDLAFLLVGPMWVGRRFFPRIFVK